MTGNLIISSLSGVNFQVDGPGASPDTAIEDRNLKNLIARVRRSRLTYGKKCQLIKQIWTIARSEGLKAGSSQPQLDDKMTRKLYELITVAETTAELSRSPGDEQKRLDKLIKRLQTEDTLNARIKEETDELIENAEKLNELKRATSPQHIDTLV